MLKIEPWLEIYLSTQPEYRMGFQKVRATLSSGGIEMGIIVNSTIFLKEGEMPWELLMNWDYVVAAAAKSNLVVRDVTLIPREPETLRGVREIAISNEKFHELAHRKRTAANSAYGSRQAELLAETRQFELSAKSAAAEDAPVTLTTAGEIFKRFSAFANDRRVTKRMGLTAGTFGTTKEDADAHIKTGTDAVARYALPNPKPASNVFTITPPNDTDLKRGTVQPANNQLGGGVEVIFVNGSPNGTVTGPKTIPDK
ncbi:MAG: hypothetical protein QOD12_2839 [Verrucomicrobiota bacterium]|jgi:hypothetical protein